jgi:hypothetical protein
MVKNFCYNCQAVSPGCHKVKKRNYCKCWYDKDLDCVYGAGYIVCTCTNLSLDDRYLCYRRNIDIFGPRCSCDGNAGYGFEQMVDEDGVRVHTEDDNESFGLCPDNNGVCNRCNRPRTPL